MHNGNGNGNGGKKNVESGTISFGTGYVHLTVKKGDTWVPMFVCPRAIVSIGPWADGRQGNFVIEVYTGTKHLVRGVYRHPETGIKLGDTQQ